MTSSDIPGGDERDETHRAGRHEHPRTSILYSTALLCTLVSQQDGYDALSALNFQSSHYTYTPNFSERPLHLSLPMTLLQCAFHLLPRLI